MTINFHRNRSYSAKSGSKTNPAVLVEYRQYQICINRKTETQRACNIFSREDTLMMQKDIVTKRFTMRKNCQQNFFVSRFVRFSATWVTKVSFDAEILISMKKLGLHIYCKRILASIKRFLLFVFCLEMNKVINISFMRNILPNMGQQIRCIDFLQTMKAFEMNF